MPNLKAFLHKLNRFNPNNSKQKYKLIKAFLYFLIVTSLIFKVIPNYAQESIDIIQQIQEGEKNPSQESWLDNAFASTAVNTLQVFVDEIPSSEDLVLMRQNGQHYIPGGLLGTATNYIAQTYTPQASGIEYFAQIKDNFLGKPVYAQGIGFQGLSPILPIWKSFRNIVYLLSAVFFTILGIMIMFRLKINPQAILTVQNSIPKVITTLLLVSFSYAIAGLLIDLLYFVQNLTIASLFVSRGKSFTDNLIKPSLLGQITHSTNFANLSGGDLGDMFKLASIALPSNVVFILGTIIGTIVGSFIGGVGGIVVGTATGGIIFTIIVLILITVCIIRFFFGILKAYVNIIFKIILGPLEIGLGAIPGMKIGFSSWITGLFANLMIFPISLLFMIIANIIIEETSGTVGLWAPSMVKFNAPGTLTSLVTGVSGGLVPVAIGISSLMILSKLPELIPQAIFAIKPFPWASALSDASSLKELPGRAVKTLEGVSTMYKSIQRGNIKKSGSPPKKTNTGGHATSSSPATQRGHRP